MSAEEALKFALVLSLVAPEEHLESLIDVAARAANLVDDGAVERIKEEIEAMTDDDLSSWVETVFIVTDAEAMKAISEAEGEIQA